MNSTRNKAALALLWGLACALPAQAQAQTTVDLFVTITSAEAQKQGLALVLASQGLQQKARVRVLLCADGGPLALKAREPAALKPRSPRVMLDELIKAGAQVDVCALFLPNSEWKQTDLIDGVGVAKPQEVAAQLLAPQTRAVTF